VRQNLDGVPAFLAQRFQLIGAGNPFRRLALQLEGARNLRFPLTGSRKGLDGILSRMREIWKRSSTFAAMAILATVIIPQTPLDAQGQGKAAPKNLKVLTPENYMEQMQTYAGALGVESQGGCNFCHEADRSLDTPMKIKAREAIELSAEINKKFDSDKIHVTCWTCHHGSPIPETARISK
jgi:hypothetical protein